MTVPPKGWHVEIDDPQSGYTWTPDVVGKPEITPGANDYPRVSIPVRKTERWLDKRYEGAPMRVWKDGKRQPIDQLEEVGESESAVTLNGRGGIELDSRVQKEVDQQEAHIAAEDIIQANTSYTANVDAPTARTETNVSVQQTDTQSEWTSALSIPSTTPAYITSGRLETAQTAFFAETEDAGSDGSIVSDPAASGGEARFYAIGGDTLSVSLDYTMPGSSARVAIRYRIPDGATSAAFDLTIDGEVVGSVSDGVFSNTSYDWFSSISGPSSDISGSTTAGFELGSTGEDIVIDAIVLYDERYSYTFDNSVDSNGYLSGPELYPDRTEVQTADSPTAFGFTGAKLSASYDDTSNNQRVGVSPDQGASWTYSNNSETVETDFGSASPQIRGKFGLSRYGSRTTASPTSGFNGQSVALYELFGDTDETPLLINQDYDDTVLSVLQDIADYGDFIFEYRLEGGSPSIEMSVPGQRVASDSPDVASYDYEKTIEEQADQVVVKSGRQRQREEEFVANHGTAVSLDQGNIDRGTEAVYDPSTGEAFVEGEDYKLSPGVETDTGSITTLSGGAMTDGATYAVDYNYHEEGTWTSASAASDPKPLVQSIPGITTERACTQAATILGRQLDEPLEEATVTLPTSAVGFDIVDAQQFASVPTDTAWEIRDISTKPGRTQFRLGSRESIGEVVGRLQRRLSAAAQRT